MSIEKRASKKAKTGYTWRVRINYTDDMGFPARHDKSGFKTKKEAQAYEAEIKNKLQRSGGFLPESITLETVYKEWMEYKKSRLAPNSINLYSKVWRIHIQPVWGFCPIEQITYRKLQSFFDGLKDNSKALNSQIRIILSGCFKYAKKAGYIDQNPLSDIEIHGKPKSECDDVLSLEDFNKIIQAIKSSRSRESSKKNYLLFMYIGYYTGLRRSEIAALECGDFDFEAMTINVSKRIEEIGGIHTTDRMKTRSSTAIIPLAEPLANMVKPICRDRDKKDLILSNNGNPVSPNIISRTLRTMAKNAGIRFHPHMLRHTFITNLIRSGLDPKTAAQLARHSNITTTMDIYTQMNKDDLKDAINRAFPNDPQKIPNSENETLIMA